jgi:hypothetical protein
MISGRPFEANKKNALLMTSIAAINKFKKPSEAARRSSEVIMSFENINTLAHLTRESMA